MPRNGSGSQSSPGSSFPAVFQTLIESAKFNTVINDINASITASIANDGQTPILANLPMSGFKHTGAAAANANGQYVEYAQYIEALALKADTASLPNPIPTGTRMPFYQASPPVGWTAAAVQNDSMMRVVTAATTGGTVGAGAGHSPILNNLVPSHTHTDAGHTHTDAGHTHLSGSYGGISGGTGGFLFTSVGLPAGGDVVYARTGSSSANIQSAAANIQANAGATNWQPRYMDFCIGQKS
jgi:hypothetical protein